VKLALYALDIAVLFKGAIVEQGDTKKILRNPLHSYTQLLIKALLGIEGRKERKILEKAIEIQRSGSILEALKRCPFALRCPQAIFLLAMS